MLASTGSTSLKSLLRLFLYLSAFLLLAFAALLAGGTGVAGAGDTGPGACEWTLVPSRNTHIYNAFHGVAVVSPTDVWSAGSSGNGNFGQLTLIQHWDGTSWTVVPSPNPGSSGNEIEDIEAISSNDVWATGYFYGPGGNTSQTLMLHWDGTAWTHVPSPSPGTFQSELNAIDAVSSNDIWAVGFMWQSGSQLRTLIEHWDGTSWTVVPSPNVNTFQNILTSVSAISANDVWAAGHYMISAGLWQTLTLHWDGTSWTIIPSPSLDALHTYVNGLSALSPNNMWAVGRRCAGNCSGFGGEQLFAMHWDGAAWTIVSTPNLDASFTYLESVVTISSNRAVAVGMYEIGSDALTLILEWDGTAWSQVASPSPSPHTCCPVLRDIEALPNGDLWVAGEHHVPSSQVLRTLSLRLPASCGPVTETPTAAPATSTPPSPTSTSTHTSTPTRTVTPQAASSTPLVTSTTAPSSTASPSSTALATATEHPPATPTQDPTFTPTPCTIEFSDVPQGSTFHPFIICLACNDILAGYGDGTFRPGNSVTRGQLAKIVSNAAGYDEPPAAQSFEDVLPGSTFYSFVERMSFHGIMQGYPCGGAGEPCGAGNLPYFRPNTNATRGQIAKIVSDAAGYVGFPPSRYFEDVPSSHTFYVPIGRLVEHGIMQGYPCGGAGEPCGVENLPYFRPSGATTRGQTAKIIANAFFPECASMR